MTYNYLINKPYWYESRVNDASIAQTILSQLKANFVVFGSWGSHNFVDMGDGLKFNVQGKKFKGQVIIKLNVDDTYIILFGQLTKKGWILREVYEGVYVDQLQELIDVYIETSKE